MTDTIKKSSSPTRAAGAGSGPPPPHPHFKLGSVAIIAVVLALVAAAIGIGALFVVAGRNSVDDAVVAASVEDILSETGAHHPWKRRERRPQGASYRN